MRTAWRWMLRSKARTAIAALLLLCAAGAAYNGIVFGFAMARIFIVPLVVIGFFAVVVTAWDLLGPGEGISLWWVRKNRDEIARGRARIGGRRILPDDEVVAYTWTVSFLLFAVRRQTDFYHPAVHDVARVRRFADLCTRLFGWWMIPFGIIWSIDGLAINRKGGVRVLVRDLVEESKRPVFRLW